MLGPIDHVGYLARDLEATVAEFSALFGLPLARRLELPEFSLLAAFLGEGQGSIEVFTFTDPELLDARLGGARVLLEHVAHEVADIDALAASMRGRGVKFAGPDRRVELSEPLQLGGVRHLWTIPETCGGQTIQLLQR
ncbi:MAG TPA: VOC family protein [Solirubrobacteraceae bacterium]|nr:VOC family protein [Solirubrobacteraceae bacterium]